MNQQQSRYASVLRWAVRTLGGEARLAKVLRVQPSTVHHWLAGGEIPLEVFLECLDVIADGPYAPNPRRIRAKTRLVESQLQPSHHHPD